MLVYVIFVGEGESNDKTSIHSDGSVLKLKRLNSGQQSCLCLLEKIILSEMT